MSYQFRNDIPVYLQIVDIITKQITSGELLPGEKILSVREYAMLLKVNPNTIQRALGVLESNKLIITNRTNGKYVTNDENVLLKYKNDLIIDKVDNFLKDVEKMGYTKEVIIQMIKER